jgi:hypothetical protein
MILKVLDYQKLGSKSDRYMVWNYFDNITSASNFYVDGSEMSVVRCTFRDGNTVTIGIPYEAYLMSDNGKTIERIFTAKDRPRTDEDGRFETLQDAIDYAMES